MGEFSDLKLTGRLATAADPDWDDARQAWNLAADPRPSAVAFVELGQQALEKVDADFLLFGVGLPMTPEMGGDQPAPRPSPRDDAALAGEGGYFNFAERPADLDEILPEET
jgi:hypothetical protein